MIVINVRIDQHGDTVTVVAEQNGLPVVFGGMTGRTVDSVRDELVDAIEHLISAPPLAEGPRE